MIRGVRVAFRLGAIGVFVWLLSALTAGSSRAQVRRPVVLLARPTPLDERRDEFVRSAIAEIERTDRVLVTDLHAHVRQALVAAGSLSPANVSVWATVSEKIRSARAASLQLHEGEALRLLTEAEQIAESNAHVSGASVWLAEVETNLGLVAAQAGMRDLSHSALTRAATLDPSRGVRSAEAPPEVLREARRIANEVATGPVGTFRVVVDAPDARVLLDEGDVGAAPRVVRASVGTHVLRVESPGYLPFGQVIRVPPGQRADVSVSLSRDPVLRNVDTLMSEAREARWSAVDAAYATLMQAGIAPFEVWIVEVGQGPRERALFTVCGDGAQACRPRVGVELADATPFASESGVARVTPSWLLEEGPPVLPPPEETPLWRRWYVIAGASAVLIGASATAIALSRGTEPDQFRVTVDPTDLHR